MDELATLVGAGATTLVTAMTTSAWGVVRAGLVRLFRHEGEERGEAMQGQLDRNAELLSRAGDPDRVREGLIVVWQSELEQLLHRYPDAVPELQALLQATQAALGNTSQGNTQNITGYGGWTIGVQSGDVHVHTEDSPPGDPRGTARRAAETAADD